MSSYGEVTASQIASQQPAPTTMQNAAVGNGAGSSLPVTGYATAILDIVASVPMGGGTTINFEASVDDTTWVPILGSLVGTTTTGTTTTDPGNWAFSVAGFKSMRARISAYSAGTITVTGYTSVLTSAGSGGSGGPSSDVNLTQVAGSSVAVNNGSANNGSIRVCIANDSAGTVAASQSGTWNINNVSGTISLPTGAATSAKQPALGTAGSASSDVITVQGITSMTALKVDGSAVTQPVSAASLPLPTGAATAAKQPALGSAGSAASDVITVQGIASMTALKVDGSASTQPISGTVTANAGTNLNTSALALESGGNLATLAGAIVSAKMQANTAQINGVAPSMNNGSAGTGVQRITICDDSTGQIAQTASKVPSSTTMQNAVSSSGNGTSLNVQGFATGVISVAGTFTATVSFEASLDDTVWVPIMGTQTGTTNSATSATTTGDWVFNVAGYKSLRARVTWTSGTSVTCKGYVSVVAGASGGGGASNVNINQIGGQSTATGNGDASSGVLRVTIANDSTGQIAQTASHTPSSTTMQNAATANGNGTSLNVQGYGTAVLDVTGTPTTLVLNFETSVDDTTWVPISGIRSGERVASSVADSRADELINGNYSFNVAGFKSLRARISNYSAGNVTVKGYASVTTQGNGIEANAGSNKVLILNATSTTNGSLINVQGYATAIVQVSGVTSSNTGIFIYGYTSNAGLGAGCLCGIKLGSPNRPDIQVCAIEASGLYVFNVAGLRYIQAVISTYTSGTISVTCSLSQCPYVPLNIPSIATFTGCNPQYTVPATPTEMITLYGSSRRMVRIRRIELLTQQTTAGTNLIYLYKRTGAAGGGTPNYVNPVVRHQAIVVETATMAWYTTNPTPGQSGGLILNGWDIQAPAAGSHIQPAWKEVFRAQSPDEALILGAENEGIGFNFNGAALPAGFKIQARIMWTEE